ncbi:MAG: hypothetical protein IT419_16190 [Planctomycetes bacterium]|nr:hypothetical protein [Planctomycetota bacterium]OQZ05553.1 MAG: hypothetical protein B6D36_09535 [Planctomycetes bacterium UTPLA1]
MTSHTTKRFRRLFAELPRDIQESARKAYQIWREDNRHPSLRFKQVIPVPPTYSVRITQAYRALGVKAGSSIVWFWIGSHDDYETLISSK